MIAMILKMSGSTLLYIILTIAVWFWTKDKELTKGKKLVIGVVFGLSSVASTHFGILYDDMVINVRDMGPLTAGLFFAPSSGIIAGFIGGIERYIAGTYFGVSSYTRIACSVSTCLAGFVAMGMNIFMFKGKKPSPFYSFYMGAVVEVFHMYIVLITHRNDMRMAYLVVSICAIPMILFTGMGLSLSSIVLTILSKEWTNPFKCRDAESESLSLKFQRWLFVITLVTFFMGFIFSFILHTQSARQEATSSLSKNFKAIKTDYQEEESIVNYDNSIIYGIFRDDGEVLKGKNLGMKLSGTELEEVKKNLGKAFEGQFWGIDSLIYADRIDSGCIILTSISKSEMYWQRNAEAYELALADILLFTVIYVMIAFLVNQIVVYNIHLINESLSKITNGNLNEVVMVRSSSEFASLSDDINQTVLALKGYIKEAEKRIEAELQLAKSIQESSLPQMFHYPERDEIDLFATMKPAKEVGGDFYDFFFVDRDKLALVIADVSGKGIPAALFMMKSKGAIRSFAESGGDPSHILEDANNALWEGNDAEMFVTAWIGIVDLTTGVVQCANAGHEYPVVKRKDGNYELLKDTHCLVLAAMPEIKPVTYEIKLEPGDRLFVYTDGVPDTLNEKGEQYGEEGMLNALNNIHNVDIANTLVGVLHDINDFKGEEKQFDDITMLGFELRAFMEKE